MPYELRLPGHPSATFASEPEAVEAARQSMAADPDAEPEVFDTATGQPTAPGVSRAWREDLKQRVGF